MCTPIHKFEFIALEDLENPLTTPNNVSVDKLANLDVKIDQKNEKNMANNFPNITPTQPPKKITPNLPILEFQGEKIEGGQKIRSVLSLTKSVRANHTKENLCMMEQRGRRSHQPGQCLFHSSESRMMFNSKNLGIFVSH